MWRKRHSFKYPQRIAALNLMMEQTPFRLQCRTLILPLLFQPPGNQQPGQTLIRMLTALRLNLHANPARQVRGPHCRVGFINVLPTRAGRAQSLETNLIRLYVLVGGKAPNADVPVFFAHGADDTGWYKSTVTCRTNVH
ncbi:Uncharacterised protein [Salmonella sp. NCTC 11881]|nr:Uncharacterised protein [Salmonella sp. NCTC 11881]